MTSEACKAMGLAMQEAVIKGMTALADRLEPRLKALEERTIPEAIKGEPGKDAELPDIEALIKQALDAFPPERVDYPKILEMIEEEAGKIVIPEDGKDALQLEVLPHIDEEKSYHRGTYASHRGGLWRAYEKTHGMRGWECIVDGLAGIDIEYDGERALSVKTIKSSGEKFAKDFSIPAMIYKDVWREGSYMAQDCVTLSGSLWVAVSETDSRPGESKDWRMVAKKGGTGKSAYDIAKEAGFVGTKQQWIDSLGKKQVKL